MMLAGRAAMLVCGLALLAGCGADTGDRSSSGSGADEAEGENIELRELDG